MRKTQVVWPKGLFQLYSVTAHSDAFDSGVTWSSHLISFLWYVDITLCGGIVEVAALLVHVHASTAGMLMTD